MSATAEDAFAKRLAELAAGLAVKRLAERAPALVANENAGGRQS